LFFKLEEVEAFQEERVEEQPSQRKISLWRLTAAGVNQTNF